MTRKSLLGIIAIAVIVGTTFTSLYFISNYSMIIYPKNEIRYSDEWFFLSIGLYENTTHPCATHSVTCTAEFKSTNVNFTITSQSGNFLITGISQTNENGFLDLNLPKGENYTVTFTIDGKQGEGIVSTESLSPTCITNIQVTD